MYSTVPRVSLFLSRLFYIYNYVRERPARPEIGETSLSVRDPILFFRDGTRGRSDEDTVGDVFIK